MSRFCPHDWHGTTEADMQHMSLGGHDYEYAVWESECGIYQYQCNERMRELEIQQKIVTDKAHALAINRGLVPYSEDVFLRLMEEVEGAEE